MENYGRQRIAELINKAISSDNDELYSDKKDNDAVITADMISDIVKNCLFKYNTNSLTVTSPHILSKEEYDDESLRITFTPLTNYVTLKAVITQLTSVNNSIKNSFRIH